MANKIYTTLRQQLKILRSKNMNISINGQGAKVKKSKRQIKQCI